MSSPFRGRTGLTVLGCLLLASPEAAAQRSLSVRLGSVSQAALTPGQELTVPVVIDASPVTLPSLSIAALSGTVSWSPCLDLLAITPGPFGQLTLGPVQLTAPGTGSVDFSLFNSAGRTAGFVLATFRFRARDRCHGRRAARDVLLATISAAGTATAQNVTGSVVTGGTAPFARAAGRMAVCVGYDGLWGDVTGDTLVNLVDAQQIARWVVSLGVLNDDRLPAYGDVLADSVVDIIDAQQIARAALGLPHQSRAGQPGPLQCRDDYVGPVRVLEVLPGDTFAVDAGRSVPATAVLGDFEGREGRYNGYPITWSTADAQVATVSAAGIVTGVVPGTTDLIGSTIDGAGRTIVGRARVTVISPAAPPPGTTVQLTITGAGSGAGSVNSAPAGVSCGISAGATSGSCAPLYANGSVVTLGAVAAPGSFFVGWSGPICGGTAACGAFLDQPRSAQARFDVLPAGQQVLTVSGLGTGAGRVFSAPFGVDCTISGTAASGSCTGLYPGGTIVTLTPAPEPGSTFVGWSGGCTGILSCTVTLTQAQSVTAEFALTSLRQSRLTVAGAGTGGGFPPNGWSIQSQPGLLPAVLCSPSVLGCIYDYPGFKLVSLTAAPISNVVGATTFVRWTEGCSGANPICQLAMSSDRKATAEFGTNVNVTFIPFQSTGTGSIEARSLGRLETCTLMGAVQSGKCIQGYISGTLVSVTATPAPGNLLTSFSPCPVSSLPCDVSAGQTFFVTFAPSAGLTIQGGGTGSGSVAATPAGTPPISCSTNAGVTSGVCATEFVKNTVVSLTPTSTGGSVFTGWTGCTTVVGTACSVTLSAARTVTATFQPPVTLTIVGGSTGNGTVQSFPTGINCGITAGTAGAAGCAAIFGQNTAVTLTALPSPGHVFTSWSGGNCSGSGPTCSVFLGVSKTVTARFTPTATLTTGLSGAGFGTVSSAPVGISCVADSTGVHGDCSEVYVRGTSVTLTATPPATTDSLTGWSISSCALSLTCAVVVQSDSLVTATFTPIEFKVAALYTGGSHTCALVIASAYCWGHNGSGQLGDGTNFTRGQPVAVLGGLGFIALSAGTVHTCGVTSGGTAYCWGENGSGQLGDGTQASKTQPGAVSAGAVQFVSIAAGQDFTCGLAVGGAAYCWGLNASGQLGDGTTTARLTPVAVSGGLSFLSLSAGQYHACGLGMTGSVYCWGSNPFGQLGDNSTTDRTSPVPVAGGISFGSVGAGLSHTCGVSSAGVAYCWGLNNANQLGDGSTTNRLVPTAVSGNLTFSPASNISVGGSHACAITAANAAYCWGANNASGVLGDGTTQNRTAPVAVAGNGAYLAIAGGAVHTCGWQLSGAAYCWGQNTFGKLGNGHTTFGQPQTTPARVRRP